MITFSTAQQALVDADFKVVTWLFKVTPAEKLYFDADPLTFDIDDLTFGAPGDTSYYWSTKSTTKSGLLYFDSDAITFDADSLTFGAETQTYYYKIIPESFRGVPMQAPLSQQGTYAGNELSIQVINKDNTYTAADFLDAPVLISMVMSNATYTEVMRRWKFKVTQAYTIYEIMYLTLKDIVGAAAEGDYPTTPAADDLFAPVDADANSTTKSSLCSPVPIGNCYVPCRCVADSTYTRGYLLGPSARTFTCIEVSSPREFDAGQRWSWGDVDFRQVTKADRFASSSWKVLHPFIMKLDSTDYGGTHTGSDDAAVLTDSTKSWTVGSLIGMRVVNSSDSSAGYITDNTATTITTSLSGSEIGCEGEDNDFDFGDSYYITAPGLWKSGGTYQDMFVNFYRDDTYPLTNPSLAIPFVLEDMGVSGVDIDSAGSFAGKSATFDSRGLEFNGAFYKKEAGGRAIANLLNSCHCTFDVEEKVKLRELLKTSQKTITSADILGQSFKMSYLRPTNNDSGYVGYNKESRPQDVFLNLLVTAKSTTNRPSSEVLHLPFVQDSENAQRLGTLFYQRKLLKEANVSFNTKSTCLAMQHSDIWTINHAHYGGSYDVTIDRMFVNKDGSISFNCTKHSAAFDDWDDLSPGAITLSRDQANAWVSAATGADSLPGTGNKPRLVEVEGDMIVTGGTGAQNFADIDDVIANSTLDSLPDGDSYGRVLRAGLSSGKINESGLAAAALARMFTSSTLKGYIEAWKHATDNSKIDGADIYALSILEAALSAAVTNRMFADSTTKTNIEGWKHTSDVTKMDPADIYKATMIATLFQISNTTEGNTASLNIRTTREVHTLAAAGTSDTTINLLSGCMLLGVSFCVNTTVSDDGGNDTWSAAFIGGSTAALATAAAAAQNTKVNTLIVPEVANAQTNVQFTANGGSFDGGVIELVAYYIDLTSLADA